MYLVSYHEIALRRYLPHDFDDVPVIAIPDRVSFFRLVGQPLQNKDTTGIATLETFTARNRRLWLVLKRNTTFSDASDTTLSG